MPIRANLTNSEIANDASRLLSEGKIKESLELLKKSKHNRGYKKRLLGINSRYRILEKENEKGVINFQDATNERNKIIDSIINIIATIEDFDENYIDQSKTKTWLLVSCIFSTILAIIILIQIQRSKEIKKIDLEIASRIGMIDISDWYRHALVTGNSNSSDLCSCLIDNANAKCFYYEKYKNENLKSLLILLLEKVPGKDKENIQNALDLLSKISSKYTDTLLNKDPNYVIKFYEEVINLNKLRWVGINNLDERSLIEETSQIEIVFREQFPSE